MRNTIWIVVWATDEDLLDAKPFVSEELAKQSVLEEAQDDFDNYGNDYGPEAVRPEIYEEAVRFLERYNGSLEFKIWEREIES